jgi:hypothetical protein
MLAAAAGGRVLLGDDIILDFLPPSGIGSSTMWFNYRTLDMDFIVNSSIGEAFKVDGGTGAVTVRGAPLKSALVITTVIYVRTDGNDANSGFANTAGGAKRNIQTAIDLAASFDNAGYDIVIQIGNGTYTENITLRSFLGSGRIILQGNISNPALVSVVTTGSTAVGGFNAVNVLGTYIISWMKIKCTGGACIRTSGGATYIQAQDLHFDASTYLIQVTDQSTVNVIGDLRINAGTYTSAFLVLGGFYRGGGIQITLVATVTMSSVFISVGRTSECLINGITWVGTFVGKRYEVTTNGVCETLTGNINYFPGTVAGTTATGGQYT